MTIRLAILAHHYRSEWDWSEDELAAAAVRLDRWRAAVTAAEAASGESVPSEAAIGETALRGSVLDAVRRRLADDLDAPAALAEIDAWADTMLADGDDPGQIRWFGRAGGCGGGRTPRRRALTTTCDCVPSGPFPCVDWLQVLDPGLPT